MIHRIDVSSAKGAFDAHGHAVAHTLAEFGIEVGEIEASRIFLLDTDAPADAVERIARGLLADPVVEAAQVVRSAPTDRGAQRIEVHLKPGVMDPVAASTEMAIRDMGIEVREVRTGRAYLVRGSVEKQQLERIATRILANPVIESVHFTASIPAEFTHGHAQPFKLTHIPLRNLSESELTAFSREKHLFLSLAEMKGIQDYFRQQDREPTDIELETIAQTWSEHCVHKTLKSSVDIEVQDETGKKLGERRYDNLIRDTIFASTTKLMEARKAKGEPAFCLSVFKDNAGVIAFDETDAVCFKVETHNHPSAIEPYGGSATGAGGVIRDILGTGLAAKPIANTDIFCVAYPDNWAATEESDEATKRRSDGGTRKSLPKGVIHPRRILQQVVAGVRDYGNRMGIPTLNGAVYFDDRYLGNPLVFCGCVGLIPNDKIQKQAQPGDAIVVMGGRTGRDGIHGATFSSAELTDTHADEFSHAVQIGNAITEKKVTDVILQARDLGLFTGCTDCGAGGLSSAVGEMGEKVGAEVNLSAVPLKYAGLRYPEIWISEAQERMVLSVPQEKVKELLALSAGEDVEATVIGTFGTKDRELVLQYGGTEVGRLSMAFLHDGIPMPRRKAVVVQKSVAARRAQRPRMATDNWPAFTAARTPREKLLAALAHPNIASKHWIVRQYDHEVQGGSAIKPFVGVKQQGPSDGAVIRPKLASYRGVALACGMAPHIEDPYDMAIAAIDEAVRNIVAVGGSPEQTAILDNFCWPSVDSERSMGDLVRTCEACHDAAMAYGIPFISGKDSLHNQFTNSETKEVIRIPNTLLISAIATVPDVRKCITMDAKGHRNGLTLIAARNGCDLACLASTHRQMAQAIAEGLLVSCHDVSDGGLLVAAAEMSIASGLGVTIGEETFDYQSAFAEKPGQYLVEIADPMKVETLRSLLDGVADLIHVGVFQHLPRLTVLRGGRAVWEVTVDEMTAAWRGTLDW
jgi:phosphoribosylformylglycinamidine synthase